MYADVTDGTVTSQRSIPKDKSERELHLFLSNSSKRSTLGNSSGTGDNLRKLVIIGARDDLAWKAIPELNRLQELWLVECGIKEIPPFKKSCKLAKLYLYSNEIEHVTNLRNCPRLKILSLAGNRIRDSKYFNGLTWIEELNLANNKLTEVGRAFTKELEIRYLNLAGNFLRSIVDVENLATLRKLDSLVFSDPLYGECPLVSLCNYRFCVLHYLRRIKKLDHYSVRDSERHSVNQFFEKQSMYCNMMLHKSLNTYLESVKDKYDEYRKWMFKFKHESFQLKAGQGVPACRNRVELDNRCTILDVELNNQYFLEWKGLELMRLQRKQRQLILNMRYCGNLTFTEYNIEYNIEPENLLISRCRKFLEESLCSVARTQGMTGVRLHGVTKVISKRINKSDALRENDRDTGLIILTSPVGVTSIKTWPFDFFETGLFNEKEITVTDCLAVADFRRFNHLFDNNGGIERNKLCQSHFHERQRVCVLFDAPRSNDKYQMARKSRSNDVHQDCQKFVLTNMEIQNPIYVLEYEYLTKDLTTVDYRDRTFQENSPNPGYNNETSECLCISSLTRILKMEPSLVHNLVKISVCGQSINMIDINLDLPNLRELDVSYNKLGEFPTPKFLKLVKVLDISFNDIYSLSINETLPVLQDLNVSWNCLTQCLKSYETLAKQAPNLSKLNISNNPFEDVMDNEVVIRVASIYFPKLKLDNNDACEISGLKNDYSSCTLSTCKQPELSTEKRHVKHSKRIHVSNNLSLALDVVKKSLNVQEFCAVTCSLTSLPITKPLKRITKLNLSSNFLTSVQDFTVKNCPALKYLDLTNNLITSLLGMGTFNTLQEFYCGHNKLDTLSDIDNIKTWHTLRIVDFSNNLVEKDSSYKQFIVFHLPNIKYISGCYIEDTDINEARWTFGNILDANMLSSVYKGNDIMNITQLRVVDCSLRKIDLCPEYLPHLESLDLRQNQISSLSKIDSFQRLHTLCLSYNCLKAFPGNNAESKSYIFPNLCTLILDHNCIDTLINITKEQMPMIRHIFLNHNFLRSIGGLNQCSTLETLVLDHNKMEIISKQDFNELTNLHVLCLENNQINTLQFIKPLQKLKKFYVANNSILDPDELRYLALLANLEEFTIEGNQLKTIINQDGSIMENFELRDF